MEGLVAQGLQKWFKHRKVVDDVSLDIQRGEVVGLLGPNGAGKTTSFYMMVGLLPTEGGRIFLEGQEITAMPMYRRCRLGVGYLPQESSVFRKLTVEGNLMAILETLDLSAEERRARAKELLAEWGDVSDQQYEVRQVNQNRTSRVLNELFHLLRWGKAAAFFY